MKLNLRSSKANYWIFSLFAMSAFHVQSDAQQLEVTSLSKEQFCLKDSVYVTYTIASPASAGNIFEAQLSDANGSFTTPVPIGSLQGENSGTIPALIPSNIPPGSKYRIRVVAGNPALTGNDNGSDLDVKARPEFDITASAASVCKGSPVTLSANPSDVSFLVTWNKSVSDGQPFIPAATEDYKVTVGNGNCSDADSITITVKPLPKIKASASATEVCAGESVTLTALLGLSIDPYTYSWNKGVVDKKAFVPVATETYTVTAVSSGCTNKDSIEVKVKPLPKIKASASATEVCAGESVTLTALLGLSIDPYTYSWNKGVVDKKAFVPAATETYTVTATSGGCTNKDSIKITVKSLPAVTASASGKSVCTGKSVTLKGLVGISKDPYTLSWDKNVTDDKPFIPTTTEKYTVTVTVGNCFNKDTITVAVLPLPDVMISVVNAVICEGGQTTLTGLGASTYVWDKNVVNGVPFSPAKTDIYTVTGTDANGCSDTAGIEIKVNHPVENEISETICSKSVYQFGSRELSSAGVYKEIFVARNGCDSTVTLNLSVSKPDNAVETDSKKGLIAAEEMASYQWLNCDKNNEVIAGADSRVYMPSESGNYAVVISDGNCTDTSACTYFKTGSSSIGSANTLSKNISVYPNPAQGSLYIVSDVHFENATVNLINIVGQRVMVRNNVYGSRLELNMSGIPEGIYILDVSEESEHFKVRIVKK